MLDILYEDNHLLAINKPAGLATMGVAADEPSAIQLARQYLKERYDKPGNVYLGVVSRLDAAATGVLLFARTSKAAARLSQQFADRSTQKTYWAIAAGQFDPPVAELLDWVRKDESQRRMAVVASAAPGAQRAELAYRALRPVGNDTLLEIELITGANIRSGCSWPAGDIRSAEIANTAAGSNSPPESPCTPGDFRSSIRRAGNRSRSWRPCRWPGGGWALPPDVRDRRPRWPVPDRTGEQPRRAAHSEHYTAARGVAKKARSPGWGQDWARKAGVSRFVHENHYKHVSFSRQALRRNKLS